VNLRVRYSLRERWQLLARITNLFDRRYPTARALAENPFDSTGRFQADSDAWTRETFLAAGAPRAARLGLRYRLKG
jgi:outer membrane receptor protein involved in Fe transport